LAVACSDYCNTLNANCTGANAQFASFAACSAACTAPTWSCGVAGSQTGNTVLCRNTFAQMAETMPDTACAKAGPNSVPCS
jgi:hypothetical protein